MLSHVTSRTFHQYCPIALALEVVGQRWSLLIVRELLLGPKRYTDLRQALPGMWTNLLAERLRQLEQAGVVGRRELPPPWARTVYELTDRGRDLEGVLLALGRWGIPLLSGHTEEPIPTVTAALLGLRAAFRPEVASDFHESYQVHIGGQPLTARVRGGALELRSGTPEAGAAAKISADPAALLNIRLGRLDPDVALATGQLRFEGSDDSIRRFRLMFDL